MAIRMLTDDDHSDYYDVGKSEMQRIKSVLRRIIADGAQITPELMAKAETLLIEIKKGEF